MCFYIEKDKFSKMFKNCTYSLNRSFPTANNMSLEILNFTKCYSLSKISLLASALICLYCFFVFSSASIYTLSLKSNTQQKKFIWTQFMRVSCTLSNLCANLTFTASYCINNDSNNNNLYNQSIPYLLLCHQM